MSNTNSQQLTLQKCQELYDSYESQINNPQELKDSNNYRKYQKLLQAFVSTYQKPYKRQSLYDQADGNASRVSRLRLAKALTVGSNGALLFTNVTDLGFKILGPYASIALGLQAFTELAQACYLLYKKAYKPLKQAYNDFQDKELNWTNIKDILRQYWLNCTAALVLPPSIGCIVTALSGAAAFGLSNFLIAPWLFTGGLAGLSLMHWLDLGKKLYEHYQYPTQATPDEKLTTIVSKTSKAIGLTCLAAAIPLNVFGPAGSLLSTSLVVCAAMFLAPKMLKNGFQSLYKDSNNRDALLFFYRNGDESNNSDNETIRIIQNDNRNNSETDDEQKPLINKQQSSQPQLSQKLNYFFYNWVTYQKTEPPKINDFQEHDPSSYSDLTITG